VRFRHKDNSIRENKKGTNDIEGIEILFNENAMFVKANNMAAA
jgi:hypothetical protein